MFHVPQRIRYKKSAEQKTFGLPGRVYMNVKILPPVMKHFPSTALQLEGPGS